jgi:hypothetical protein
MQTSHVQLDLPRNNRESALPGPRVHVLNVANLPQYPWANHDRPEKLYKDGRDPGVGQQSFDFVAE